MQVVFMRQAQYWGDDPILRKRIFRFEPIGSRDAALRFLAGSPSDPLPTLVGVIADDAILGKWLEAGAEKGFYELWECVGSGIKKWQTAKELKRTYDDSDAIRTCVSSSPPPTSKRARL